MSARRPSHRAPVSLLAIAWLHISRAAAAAATITFGLSTFFHPQGQPLVAAGICGAVWIFLTAIHSLESSRVSCAVCAGSLFVSTKNTKHQTARRFLGSHRMRTALQVVLTTSYRCPHCGGKVECHHREKEPKKTSGPTVNRGRRARLPVSSRSNPDYVFHARVVPPGKKRNPR